jgi:hypothetical protein
MARNIDDQTDPENPDVEGKTLRIGSAVWAIGLTWSPGSERTITLPAARVETRNLGNDLFVLNGGQQLATTSTAAGHKQNMPSLAMAMVIEAGNQNLIAAYPCSNGQYYIVAVLEGIVWPTFDDVYSAEQARSMVFDLTSRSRFDRVYGDPLIVHNPTEQDTLHDLTRGVKQRRCRLQSTSRRGTYVKLGAIAAAGVLLYIGVNFYRNYEIQQLIQEGQAQQAIQAQEAAMQAKFSQPVYPPMPSIGSVRGIDALRACVNFMINVPEYLPGWDETKLECDGTSVVLTMSQDDIGTVNWLAPYIGQYKNPVIALTLPKIATATWTLDPTTMKTWPKVPGPRSEITTRYITSQLEEIGTDFDLGPAITPTINTHTVGNRPISVPANYSTMTLDLKQTPYIHDEIGDILERIQNMTLLKVEEDLPEHDWTINLLIYHDTTNDPSNGNLLPVAAASP